MIAEGGFPGTVACTLDNKGGYEKYVLQGGFMIALAEVGKRDMPLIRS